LPSADMLIVRHFKAPPPYHDYNQLTLKELDAIALSENDLSIQEIKPEDVSQRLADRLREGTSPVYCSLMLRTRMTYEGACKAVGATPIQPILDERLKELWCRPSGFVPSPINPLEGIRSHIYPSLLAGHPDLENLDALIERTESLLDNPALKNAICFSHGFFIKFAKAYAHVGRDRTKLSAALAEIPPVGYLEDVEL
jgi:hypothetical protein